MMHAFRESVDPATVRAKSLEARLAQESQRCLQIEKQVQALSESAAEAVARINELEAMLAGDTERMLQIEKQMQAFLGSTKHPIAQVRDLEPRIVEPEQSPAEIIQRGSVKVPRQARRKV
jgi:chromosome segregation ATPase